MSERELDTPEICAQGANRVLGSTRRTGTDIPAGRRLLSGGCCSDDSDRTCSDAPMSANARRARAIAGLGFLAVAGALGSRRLPGRIALWPTALVPTWFGISHLVAGVTGYEGCPELGAIPSVMLNRPVTTSCQHWQRIDRRIDSRRGRGSRSLRDGPSHAG
jgi:hypothetical protein